jgi:hypothetical protein
MLRIDEIKYACATNKIPVQLKKHCTTRIQNKDWGIGNHSSEYGSLSHCKVKSLHPAERAQNPRMYKNQQKNQTIWGDESQITPPNLSSIQHHQTRLAPGQSTEEIGSTSSSARLMTFPLLSTSTSTI